VSHSHDHLELSGEELEARKTELRQHLDQLFPNYPAEQIDEVINSTAFQFRRCSCGDWEVKLV